MSVTCVRWDGPARLYAVLAHLDLGRDAASLYDPRLGHRPWVAGLVEAYRAASGRLQLHALGLHAPHDLLVRLRERPGQGLSDPMGRALCVRVAEAIEDLGDTPIPYAEVPTEILGPLSVLREALWERQGGAPSLTVADCPALRRAGRATSTDRGRVVAVSLGQDPEHVLCQVLHEETHALTDPIVSAQWRGRAVPRDTAVGSAGYAQHQAYETAAVEVGEAIIAARAPRWLDAYHRWRARFGA